MQRISDKNASEYKLHSVTCQHAVIFYLIPWRKISFQDLFSLVKLASLCKNVPVLLY